MSIPPAARRILDFIARHESRGYGDVYGPNRGMLGRDLTAMTVREVLEWQEWLRAKGAASTAAGRYQIIYRTLRGLRAALRLTGAELFDADMQDRMGFSLMRGRGWDSFAEGELGVRGFALALAKEWASLPVLDTVQGAHRMVHRGQSYYAGDGLNKAGASADEFARVLAAAQERPVEPQPAPPVSRTPEPQAGPWARLRALWAWVKHKWRYL